MDARLLSKVLTVIMSRKSKVYYLNIFIILCLITSIRGICRVRYPADLSLRPDIYKIVGSHTIKINLEANSVNYIELYENQEIEAQCNIKFEIPEKYETSNQLYIKCFNNYIYIKTNKNGAYNLHAYTSEINLVCSFIKWNLYESSNNYTWCSSNVISYIVARPKHSQFGYDYLAGICYDINNLAFSSVYYTLAPQHSEYMLPSNLTTSYAPGLEIKYIKETFPSHSISSKDFDNEQFQNMFTYTNYSYSSIIQMPKLNSTFNQEFSSLLEFVWWPNLRLNNWKRYETALEKHVESDKQAYDIIAGVSAVLKAPIIENCQTNFTMKDVISKSDNTIPLYVWNYLQARGNSSNEFVIIGFNSPFNEFYSLEDIIFCPDKCQEISWLANVSSSFRYSVMGIIFCCNVEDVKSSKRLYGFPNYDFQRKSAEIMKLFEKLIATNQLFVKCMNSIQTKTNKKHSYSMYSYESAINLRCSTIKWKLYESSEKFTWCPFYLTSYFAGRPSSLNNYIFLAGICYNTYDQSVSSVYYTLAPKHSVYMKPSNLKNSSTPPLLEIQYIDESFGPNNITKDDFVNEQFQNMFTYTNYGYSSIIQMPKLNSTFNQQFSSLLEFLWWPNLRLNNWRRYEAALEKHVEGDKQAYDIVAGISGVMEAPSTENCQTNYTMEEVIIKTDSTIPLYVWNYLQASDNSTNEIVIIGLNSPFNEFYAEKDIIFCPDICHEIPWLKKISSTFRYNVMGIIFCCNVEDVKTSKRLNGFPNTDLKSKPVETLDSGNNLNTSVETDLKAKPTETVDNENNFFENEEEEEDY
ncbi:hypothetical protein CVS40_4699 [Lucilia cuprina]|nr:hypothetical protein CVS40_4699 [Lucilia cuprina]